MKPYSLGREEGEAIWMFDALDTIKADAEQTGGSFTVVELRDFEGSSVPLHVNDRWDRGFYILDGEYTFVIGDERVAGSTGTWVFVPRNTPHAWRCNSPAGRLLNVTVPGGFEDFYRQAGESVMDRTQVPARIEPDSQLSRARRRSTASHSSDHPRWIGTCGGIDRDYRVGRRPSGPLVPPFIGAEA